MNNMLRFKPGTLRFRLAASYLLLGAITVIFVAFAVYFLSEKEGGSQNIEVNKLTAIIGKLSKDVHESNMALTVSILSGTSLQKNKSTLADSLNVHLESLKTLDLQTSHQNKIKEITGNILAIVQAHEKLMSVSIELSKTERVAADNRNESEDLEQDIQVDEEDPAGDVVEELAEYKARMEYFSQLARQLKESVGPLTADLNHSMDELLSSLNQNEGQNSSLDGFFFIVLPIGILSVIIMAILSFIYIDSSIQKSIILAKRPLQILSKGDLPETEETPNNEMGVIIEEINRVTRNIGKIKDFALEVGSGHYDSDTGIFDNEGEIGKSLVEMRNSLKQIDSDEKERNWFNEGFAKFSDVLRQNGDNLRLLTQNVVSQLVRFLKANQGGIFILNDENKDEPFLELMACYAYERNKFLKKHVLLGEGLVGQCFLEKKSIYMKDIPQEYVIIKSGLGGSNPDNIFIVPLMVNDEVFGILELASFNRFKKIEMDFVEKAAESIASTVSAVKIAEHTKKLLTASQLAAEQLKNQEEEMRQNMEELAATQEEMRRNQNSVVENEQKTRLIFLNALDAIITMDETGTIDLFNPAAEKTFGYALDEVKGRNIDMLLPNDSLSYGPSAISDINGILGVIGRVHELPARKKDGSIFSIRIKIEEGTIGAQKILLAFIKDATDHEVKKKAFGDDTETQITASPKNLESAVSEDAARKKLSGNKLKMENKIDEENGGLKKSARRGK